MSYPEVEGKSMAFMLNTYMEQSKPIYFSIIR